MLVGHYRRGDTERSAFLLLLWKVRLLMLMVLVFACLT